MLFKKDFNKNINRKIIVTDFRHLDPDSFKPVYNLTKKELTQELILVTNDGRLYINSTNELHSFFAGIFNILIAEDFQMRQQTWEGLLIMFLGHLVLELRLLWRA